MDGWQGWTWVPWILGSVGSKLKRIMDIYYIYLYIYMDLWVVKPNKPGPSPWIGLIQS